MTEAHPGFGVGAYREEVGIVSRRLDRLIHGRTQALDGR